MTARKNLIALRSTLAACAMALALGTGAGTALAADAPAPAHPAPSKEMREQMASMHERMAACLRSDKAIEACHEEMMKACKDKMGDKGCPMMGSHDHKMMDHHMDGTAPK